MNTTLTHSSNCIHRSQRQPLIWTGCLLVWLFFGPKAAFVATAMDPLDNWVWRYPLPTGNALEGVTSGDGLLVAVGNYGTVVTSTNGIDWTLQKTPFHENLRSVAWGKGVFVAVGGATPVYGVGLHSFPLDHPVIATSYDGKLWLPQYVGTNDWLSGTTYGDNRFVTVGLGGSVLTSTDGFLWTVQTNLGACLDGVSHGDGKFLAVGTVNDASSQVSSGIVLSLSNGEQWERRFTRTNTFLQSAVHAQDSWVVVGSDLSDYSSPGVILRSPNLINWSEVSRQPAGCFLSGVAYGKGRFVAVGGGRFYSDNGTLWQIASTGGGSASVTYGLDQFVAAGTGAGNGISLDTSPDGVNWTDRIHVADVYGVWSLDDVIHGNEVCIASDSASGNVIMSPDRGRHWHKPGYQPGLMDHLAFGNDSFLGITRFGDVWISTDGSQWRPVSWGPDPWSGPTRLPSGCAALIYAEMHFLALGTAGELLTSQDGITWAQRGRLTTHSIECLRYENGVYLALGKRADRSSTGQFTVLLTSPDGLQWSERHIFSAGLSASGIAFGNGHYVAISSGYTDFLNSRWTNLVAVSADAVQWQEISLPSLGPSHDVAWGGGMFLAVGDFGQVLSSPDGRNWQPRYSGCGSDLHRVVYHDNAFLVVGSNQAILQSGEVEQELLAPFIVEQPSNQSAPVGGSATFGVTVTGSSPLSYQWYFNGEPIANATGASLKISNVQPDKAGKYFVQVRNPVSMVLSDPAFLTVESSTQPLIGVNPTVLAFGDTGTELSFEVWNSGGGTLNYELRGMPSWVSGVNPSSGSSTGSGDKVTHTVTIDRSKLEPGDPSFTITITSAQAGNSPRTVQLAARRLANIRITQFEPADGAANVPVDAPIRLTLTSDLPLNNPRPTLPSLELHTSNWNRTIQCPNVQWETIEPNSYILTVLFNWFDTEFSNRGLSREEIGFGWGQTVGVTVSIRGPDGVEVSETHRFTTETIQEQAAVPAPHPDYKFASIDEQECGPVAITYLLCYWDDHTAFGQGPFTKLVQGGTGTGEHVGDVDGLKTEVKLVSLFFPDEGLIFPQYLLGLKSMWGLRGYSGAIVVWCSWPSYSWGHVVENCIQGGLPVIYLFGAAPHAGNVSHAAAAFGYVKGSETAWLLVSDSMGSPDSSNPYYVRWNSAINDQVVTFYPNALDAAAVLVFAAAGGTAMVGPRGAYILHSLTVPPGALSADTTITINAPPPEVKCLNDSPADFGPAGTTFSVPATVVIQFRAEDIPTGSAASDMRLFVWNGTLWEPVPGSSVDADKLTVSAPIYHLSVYCAATVSDHDGDGLIDLNEYVVGTDPLHADTDGDSMSDLQEVLAGTSPLSEASVFRITANTTSASTTVLLSWPSALGRRYTLLRSTNAAFGFASVRTNIQASPPRNAYSDLLPGTGAFFYRLLLEP